MSAKMITLPIDEVVMNSNSGLAAPISTAPAIAPAIEPTPPSTTTMNESMIQFCPVAGPTEPSRLTTQPAMPARPLPRAKVRASTAAVLIPIAPAIDRFCITARMLRPVPVRFRNR